ncbi:MAG: Maf family protein [Caldilinea sp.]
MTTLLPLILASASQRRQQFLRDLGLAFAIRVADIDETPLPAEDPAAMTQRLAEAKAQAVALRLPAETGDAIIVASDTTVALSGVIYGKPIDAEDAAQMLRDLRDRAHEVISAVTVLRLSDRRLATRINRTEVTMRAYDDAEIAAYVASGDPLDKAGAYGIQSPGFAPACALDGCFASVMGLPLADLCDLLADFGVHVDHKPAQVCAAINPFPCCADRSSHSTHIEFA